MSRYTRSTPFTYMFGPGPITPAVKWIIWANVAAFLATTIFPGIILYCGLIPEAVIGHLWVWQPVTYMFLHAGIFHVAWNLLAIWMFGVELERMWGTKEFLRFYAITGIGAAVTTIAVSMLPWPVTAPTYTAVTVGASGALYGILVAYAIYFPDRPILMFLLFPVAAKYFVLIIGAMSYFSAGGAHVAHAAHLGGAVVGYLYLRSRRGGMMAEIKYHYLKWKMNRLRRKFDVYSGSRGDWNRKIH